MTVGYQEDQLMKMRPGQHKFTILREETIQASIPPKKKMGHCPVKTVALNIEVFH